jgi:DNA mismatch repair protein MutS
VLHRLEEIDRKAPAETLIDDLPLFSAARGKPAAAEADPLLALLDAIVPDELSPREALEALYRLKAARPRDA